MEKQVNNLDNKEESNAAEPANQNPNETGLDNWNQRLDENLEDEAQGDPVADEKANEYSEENGSGDQSDAKFS